MDDHKCELYLMYASNDPIATARIRKHENLIYEIESVMVGKSHRGKGVGTILLQFLLLQIPGILCAGQNGSVQVYLNSLTHAIPFYKKRGFEVEGPLFYLKGVEHRKMILLDTRWLLRPNTVA